MNELKLLRVLDYFVFDKFKHDNDSLHEARILAGVLLAYSLLLVLASATILLILKPEDKILEFINTPLPVSGFELGALLTLGISVIFVILLYWLKYSGNYLLVCRANCTIEYICVTLAICFTQGPVYSHVTQLMIIPCIKAFCLMGVEAGIRWSLAALGTLITLAILNQNGINFIDATDPSYIYEARGVVSLITFFAVLSMIIIYETITKRLKRERDQEHKRYVHLAEHDPLTELANRNYFEQRLAAATTRQQRRQNGNISGLIYIDLNNFKPINDSFGHDIGDDVLRMVAKRLLMCIRNSDTVARIGGDEFAIIITDLHNKEEVVPIARKIVRCLKDPFYVDRYKLSISASLGIALYPFHTECPIELKKLADTAMYAAKSDGDEWRVFSSELLKTHRVVDEEFEC